MQQVLRADDASWGPRCSSKPHLFSATPLFSHLLCGRRLCTMAVHRSSTVRAGGWALDGSACSRLPSSGSPFLRCRRRSALLAARGGSVTALDRFPFSPLRLGPSTASPGWTRCELQKSDRSMKNIRVRGDRITDRKELGKELGRVATLFSALWRTPASFLHGPSRLMYVGRGHGMRAVHEGVSASE